MLQVRFAEMQRSVSKSLCSSLGLQGITLGGDLGVAARHRHAQHCRGLADGFARQPPDSTRARARSLFGFNAGGLEVGMLLEALEIARRRPHPGRAEPHRPVGPGGQLPRRRRIPGPGRPGGRRGHRRVQALRRGAELHPPRGGRRPHQPRARGRGVLASTPPTASRRAASPSTPSAGARPRPRSRCATARASPSPACCRTTSATSTARCRSWATSRCWARCSASAEYQRAADRARDHRHAAPRDADPRRGPGAAHRPGAAAHRARPVPVRPRRGVRRRPSRGRRGRGGAAGLLGSYGYVMD